MDHENVELCLARLDGNSSNLFDMIIDTIHVSPGIIKHDIKISAFDNFRETYEDRLFNNDIRREIKSLLQTMSEKQLYKYLHDSYNFTIAHHEHKYSKYVSVRGSFVLVPAFIPIKRAM